MRGDLPSSLRVRLQRPFAEEWRAVQDIRKGAAFEIKSLLVKGRHALLQELISGASLMTLIKRRPGSRLSDRHLQVKPHAGLSRP